jgi:hypothetical protein
MRTTCFQRLARDMRLLSLISALSIVLCDAAASQPRQDGSPSGDVATKAAVPSQNAGRLSKFETRRIRHTCRDEANKSVTPAGRKDFMSHCLSEHFSARRFTRECKSAAELKSLDKSARDEFLRACVAEKLKSFAPAPQEFQKP